MCVAYGGIRDHTYAHSCDTCRRYIHISCDAKEITLRAASCVHFHFLHQNWWPQIKMWLNSLPAPLWARVCVCVLFIFSRSTIRSHCRDGRRYQCAASRVRLRGIMSFIWTFFLLLLLLSLSDYYYCRRRRWRRRPINHKWRHIKMTNYYYYYGALNRVMINGHFGRRTYEAQQRTQYFQARMLCWLHWKMRKVRFAVVNIHVPKTNKFPFQFRYSNGMITISAFHSNCHFVRVSLRFLVVLKNSHRKWCANVWTKTIRARFYHLKRFQ